MNFRHLIGFIFCRDFGGSGCDVCCASQQIWRPMSQLGSIATERIGTMRRLMSGTAPRADSRFLQQEIGRSAAPKAAAIAFSYSTKV
jgi:hypothetical protein